MPLADDVKQELAGAVDQRLSALLGEDGPLGKRLAGMSAAIEKLRDGKAKGEHGEPSELQAAIRQAEAKGEEALRLYKEAEAATIENAIRSALTDECGLDWKQARAAVNDQLALQRDRFVKKGAEVKYLSEKGEPLPLGQWAKMVWAPEMLDEFVPPKRGAGLRRSGDKGSPGKVQLTIQQIANGEHHKRGLKPGDFEVSGEE